VAAKGSRRVNGPSEGIDPYRHARANTINFGFVGSTHNGRFPRCGVMMDSKLQATLNLERVGRPLPTIEEGTLKSKLDCVADENESCKVNHKFKKIDLPVGSKFQIVPNTHKEHEIVFICGPSGSEKSTFTAII
jgi:hypothetical protein